MNGSLSLLWFDDPLPMQTEDRVPPLSIAVIDIGTNTVLLLIAGVEAGGTLTTAVYEQRTPRLGRGVDAGGRLHPESMERAVQAVEEFRGIIARRRRDAVAVFGTSAVRDAQNRDELASLMLARTGFPLEVLSGNDEALWTYRGAISGVPGIAAATVIDIGGGSTEITSGTGRRVTSSASLNIGSVRLTERLLLHDPPLRRETDDARSTIRRALCSAAAAPGSLLVAVAGTATTLALLAQKRPEFSIEAVSGYVLPLHTVSELRASLERRSSRALRGMAPYMEGRHDIITAGALILEEAMVHFGFERVLVSERGVRYGVALREAERVRGRAPEQGKTDQ